SGTASPTQSHVIPSTVNRSSARRGRGAMRSCRTRSWPHIASLVESSTSLDVISEHGEPPGPRGETNGGTVTRRHYVVQGGRICLRKQTRDGVVVVPLANFTARIVEEVVLDNGAEVTRAYVVEGKLADGDALPRIQVPAQRFASLAFAPEQWGARAIV